MGWGRLGKAELLRETTCLASVHSELRQALRSGPLPQPLQTWLSNTSSPLEVGFSDLRGMRGRGSLMPRHTQHSLSSSHSALLMENNMAQLYRTTIRNLHRLIARRGCVLPGVCLHYLHLRASHCGTHDRYMTHLSLLF